MNINYNKGDINFSSNRWIRKDYLERLLSLEHTYQKSSHPMLIILEGSHGTGKTQIIEAFKEKMIRNNKLVLIGSQNPEKGNLCPIFNITKKIDQIMGSMASLSLDISNETDNIQRFNEIASYFMNKLQELSKIHSPILLFPDFYLGDDTAWDFLVLLAGKGGLWKETCNNILPYFMVFEWKELNEYQRQSISHLSNVEVIKFSKFTHQDIKSYLQSDFMVDRLYSLTNGDPSKIDQLLIMGGLENSSKSSFINNLSNDALTTLWYIAESNEALNLEEISKISGIQCSNIILEELCNTRLIQKKIIDESIYVSLLNKRYKNIIQKSIPETLKSHITLKIAQYKEKIGENFSEVAQLYFNAGENQKGVECALKAVEGLMSGYEYETLISLLLKAEQYIEGEKNGIWEKLAELYRFTGNYEKAIYYQKKLIEIEPYNIERVIKLGNLYIWKGEIDEASRILESVLTNLPKENSNYPELVVSLGELYYELGKYDKIEQLISSLESYNKNTYLELLNIKGKVYLGKGEFKNAIELYNEIEESGNSWKLFEPVIKARINKAIAYFQTAEYDKAENLLNNAYEDSKRRGYLRLEAFSLENLGIIYHFKRNYKLALEYFRNALKYLNKLDNRIYIARITNNLGELYLYLGDVKRALELRSFGLFLTKYNNSIVLDGLGYLLEARSHFYKKEFNSALKAIVEAEQRFNECGHESRLIDSLLLKTGILIKMENSNVNDILMNLIEKRHLTTKQKAYLYNLMGLNKSENIIVRIKHLLTSVEYYKNADDIDSLWKIYIEIAKCYQTNNENDKTKEYINLASDTLQKVMEYIPKEFKESYICNDEYKQLLELKNNISNIHAKNSIKNNGSYILHKNFPKIIGVSSKIKKILQKVERLACSDSTVLIRGESGTGKELIAEAIHYLSLRKDKPLIKVNCAALVETLLLSELFGHEKGAFTDAVKKKIGRFELANGGTIFLDEIGDIPPKTQASLLRVLQEKTFERVGGTTPIKVDVRIVCATNRNLEQLVSEGKFRQDLYYRLKGIELVVPSLRERKDDIIPIAEYILTQSVIKNGQEPKELDDKAKEILVQYSWPGNVRELENALQSISLFSDGNTITSEDIIQNYPTIENCIEKFSTMNEKEVIIIQNQNSISIEDDNKQNLKQIKQSLEKKMIEDALIQSKGNITKAAEILGMKRPRLSQLVKAYGLKSFDTNINKEEGSL